MSFQENLDTVLNRVRAACERAGRNPGDVKLLVVTKTLEPDRIREAVECGVTVFGESRIQEAKAKIPMCAGHLRWHMIGHLQTNKVREAVRLFEMIHAVDSMKLLKAIQSSAEAAGRVMPVCLEVNVSGESSKFGFAPEAVSEALAAANGLMNVELVGLMTIPPVAEDPEHARPFFRRLRELRDQWRGTSGYQLPELSMGMSHDYEVAVEEGASWIRLGSVLFGSRTT